MRYVWDDIWKFDSYSEKTKRVSRALRRLQAIKSSLKEVKCLGDVLELGCGDGSFAECLYEDPTLAPLLYKGYDKSQTAIERAKKGSAGKNGTLVFEVADIQNNPIEPQSADTVFILGVLEHLQEPEQVLKLVHKACRPDSSLIITTSNKLSLMYFSRLVREKIGRWPYGYQKNYTPDEIKNLISIDFEIEHCSTLLGDWDFPVSALLDRISKVFTQSFGRYVLVIATPK